MKLKLSGHVHSVARKSEDAFEVDGVRVEASSAVVGSSAINTRGFAASAQAIATR